MVAPTSTGIVHVVSLSGTVHMKTLAVSPLTVAFAKILTTADNSALSPPIVSFPSAVRTAIPSIEEVAPISTLPTAPIVAIASIKEVASMEVMPRLEKGIVENGEIENILIDYGKSPFHSYVWISSLKRRKV